LQAKLSKAFSECLARIIRGEAVNSCMAEYPKLRQQLVPLLYTALSISTIPKVSPSDDFRKLSKGRLLARLQERSIQAEKSREAKIASSRLGILYRGLESAITNMSKVAVPITLLLILVLQCFSLFGMPNFISLSPAPALASHCTLSTLAGNVQLQIPDSSTWEEAKNGMTVKVGSRVKTDQNSQAMLTFFNGTTLTIEPSTDLEVERVECGENQPTVIVLKQWLGKTWSRVTKLADPGSHYEIQTPSGIALVRGTLFTTEVDKTGAMRVQTIEGLVSVSAQGEEVYLPAGRQTIVALGASPSEPMPVSYSESEKQWGQSKEETPLQSTDVERPGSQVQEKEPEKLVVTESSAERAQSSVSTGQDIVIEEQREQSKENPSAKSLDNEEPPGQTHEGLLWKGQYETWMFAVIIGAVIFSFGLAVTLLRRQ